MLQQRYTSSAFSIIEVLIWIFVFSLGLVSIFALLTSSLSVNDRNKNSIIASNLAREQIELIKNIRDRNYLVVKPWNQHNPGDALDLSDFSDSSLVFLPDNFFSLERDYSSWEITVDHIWATIPEWVAELVEMWDMTQKGYRLCFDSENRYTRCTSGAKETPFYKYLHITKAQDASGNELDDAYRVRSKVVWYMRWYHEYFIDTIITDWRRI